VRKVSNARGQRGQFRLQYYFLLVMVNCTTSRLQYIPKLRLEILKLNDDEGNNHSIQAHIDAIVGERAREGIISNDITTSSTLLAFLVTHCLKI
jgi:hypothetical protein